MIEVHTIMTGKGYSPKDKYCIFGENTEHFNTLDEVQEYLKDQYGTCRRSKMYRDKDGKSEHIGYVFGFRNSDISHVPVDKWLQQDWVSILEVNYSPVF